VRSDRPHRPLADELRRAGLEVLADEPLAAHTSYRIGGPADLFAYARSAAQLTAALRAASAHRMPYLLLGGGSNLLVGDGGVRGLVICNRCAGVRLPATQREGEPIALLAQTGIGLAALARRAAAQGWGGLAWAEGIPGTLGGAIVNNAGAFGASMADVVVEVERMDVEGSLGVWTAPQLEFGYRSSRLKGARGAAVLLATLRLTRSDPATERRKLEEYAAQRRQRQPAGASAGSVFKNPSGESAGRLIEEAGLKGKRVGGAHVSAKHANFIVNDRHATAGDVRALIELAQSSVWQRFGIQLELEIELVGAF